MCVCVRARACVRVWLTLKNLSYFVDLLVKIILMQDMPL